MLTTTATCLTITNMKHNKNSGVIAEAPIFRKAYKYTKDNVELSFVLRTDVEAELKAFKECLVAAMEDIDADIEAKNK